MTLRRTLSAAVRITAHLLSRPRLLIFTPRAIWELAHARAKLRTVIPTTVQALNLAASHNSGQGVAKSDETIELIAFLLPRIAVRLPWRADCLVQAIAAQSWLKSRGIASEITIGVDKPASGEFTAHAWLTSGERIVTGGEIAAYSPLLIPETHDGR